eukprot:4475573-Alexandrium_andersonii.AAC.1
MGTSVSEAGPARAHLLWSLAPLGHGSATHLPVLAFLFDVEASEQGRGGPGRTRPQTFYVPV